MKPEVIIIYGPSGSGKTTNAEALKELFKCDNVGEETLAIKGGESRVLLLTNLDMLTRRINFVSYKASYRSIIHVEDAKILLGDKWVDPTATRPRPIPQQ